MSIRETNTTFGGVEVSLVDSYFISIFILGTGEQRLALGSEGRRHIPCKGFGVKQLRFKALALLLNVCVT